MNIAQKSTVNKSSRGNYKPSLIVWHIAEGSYNGTISWEKNPASQTSSHFVLGKNGEITQLVPLNMAAWTQGVDPNKDMKPTNAYVKAHKGINPNLYCISIECEGKWSETKGKLTDKQLEAAAELTRHIVSEVKRIYGAEIPIDREHMIGHCEINSVTRPHCPGELFQYDELIYMANQKTSNTGGSSSTNTPSTSTNELTYTVQVGAYSQLNNAESLKSNISKVGYYCFIVTAANLYRVCVGKFKTSEEAQKTCNDMAKKGINGFVSKI